MEVDVREAEITLSQLLRRVERGEPVIISREGTPAAELIRVKPRPGGRKIWGNVRGSIGPDFDKPLDGFGG